MFEIIDEKTGRKLMANIICRVECGKNPYLVYWIQRDAFQDNVFVSKLIKNSEAWTLNDDFSGGEKEVLDKVIAKVIAKKKREVLEEESILIYPDVKLSQINKFDINKCYVTTLNRDVIRDCMFYYGFLFNKSKGKVILRNIKTRENQGFISNMVLIIFAIFAIIFCVGLLIEVFVLR